MIDREERNSNLADEFYVPRGIQALMMYLNKDSVPSSKAYIQWG